MNDKNKKRLSPKMKALPLTVKVLGCSGGKTPQTFTTSFLVNHQLAVDAGSLCINLSLEEQKKLKHILITHTHFDHIKDLAFLADNLVGTREEPLMVYGSAETIKGIHTHLFNDVLWPDFTKIPNLEKPILKFKALPTNGELVTIGGFKVQAVSVNHIPGAVGYILTYHDTSLLFTGDTCETDKIWNLAHQTPQLKAIFTEISFPSTMKTLAQVSHHFCPATFEAELKKLKGLDVPVYVSHFKPGLEAQLVAEIKSRNLAAKKVQILQQGFEFKF